jgi:guanylate kinase
MSVSKRNNFRSDFSPLKTVLFVLSGPSGVGKDAVLSKLKECSVPLKYIVTMTTRSPRETEIQGKDYNFVSEQEFRELIKSDGLLEWANVYGNLYGVPARDVTEALDKGIDVMVKVDIQGVANILRKKPDAVTIFLTPPSLEELFERLKQRRTESASSMEIRMKTASGEMEAMKNFDYAVINPDGEIEKAVSDIKSIITAEKCRIRKK